MYYIELETPTFLKNKKQDSFKKCINIYYTFIKDIKFGCKLHSASINKQNLRRMLTVLTMLTCGAVQFVQNSFDS